MVLVQEMENVNLIYRICYKKEGSLIFISQLDMQDVLQRAFRRGRIKLEFTEGFNPHPKLSFSPPLPLFASSDEEYFEIALTESYEVKELKQVLEQELPEGISINWIVELDENGGRLKDFLKWAEYKIELKSPLDNTQTVKLINTYLTNTDEIVVTKRNKKKKMVEKNITEQIKIATCYIEDNKIMLQATLSLVNDSLLNPPTLVNAITQNIEVLSELKVLTTKKIKTFDNI